MTEPSIFARRRLEIFFAAASSADAGVDLVANPDAMLDPKISARVLIRALFGGDGRTPAQLTAAQALDMLA